MQKTRIGIEFCLRVVCKNIEIGKVRPDIKMKTKQSMYTFNAKNIVEKPEWIYNFLFKQTEELKSPISARHWQTSTNIAMHRSSQWSKVKEPKI